MDGTSRERRISSASVTIVDTLTTTYSVDRAGTITILDDTSVTTEHEDR